MKIREITDREPLIPVLLEIWESSVRATHLFLSEDEILRIRGYVPQTLLAVARLVIAEDVDGKPIAFLGAEHGRLEMLFLSPEVRGRGLGRKLLEYGMAHFGIRELTVNEQNPQAVGSYEHMGFHTYRRTDCDEEGGPYPLLYMKLD